MLERRDVRARPGERVAEPVRRLGEPEVVAWCGDLLDGAAAYDEPVQSVRRAAVAALAAMRTRLDRDR